MRLARSSSAIALPGQAAQGYPVNTGRESRGGLLSVTFLGRARKVTSRRAAPGHSFALIFSSCYCDVLLKINKAESIHSAIGN